MFCAPFNSFTLQPWKTGFVAIEAAFSNASTKAAAESLSWLQYFFDALCCHVFHSLQVLFNVSIADFLKNGNPSVIVYDKKEIDFFKFDVLDFNCILDYEKYCIRCVKGI